MTDKGILLTIECTLSVRTISSLMLRRIACFRAANATYAWADRARSALNSLCRCGDKTRKQRVALATRCFIDFRHSDQMTLEFLAKLLCKSIGHRVSDSVHVVLHC